MKNIKTLTLIFLLIASGLVNAATPTVMRIDSIRAKPLSEISVPLYVDFSSVQGGVGSMTIYVEYDPDVLAFQGYTNLDTLVTDPFHVVIIGGKYLLMAWYSVTDPLRLTGKLLDLQFYYSGGTGDLVFDVGRCLLSDDVAMPLSGVDYQNGNVSEIDDTGAPDMLAMQAVIYPNPATNLVTIGTPYPLKYVEIYDLAGRVLLTGQNKQIDVSCLAPGVYYIRVTGDQDVSVHKLIKNN